MTREIEARLRLSAVDRTGKAFKAVGRRFHEVDKRAQQYNKTQTAVARTSRAMNAEMVAFGARVLAPVALAAGIRKTVSAAADFEEALFNIQKKSGASAAEIEKLKTEIIDLGDEVPVSLDELASAFERGAAAGIPLDELREFAKLTSQVADSWDMTAEDVANAFAGFEKGMNIPRGELEQFADLINYLADSGIADERDIVQFVDRVGASLNAVGMTREDIAGVGAAMVNLKMPAEIAARAMDTLMGKLVAPKNLTKGARVAITEIVGDVEKFSELMKSDATGGLLYFLEQLEKKGGQERIGLLGALLGQGFDDEVARLVAGLAEVKRNIEAAQDVNAYQGSIAGLSEKRLELFNSKMTVLKNTVHAIGIGLGEWALPAIEKPLGWLQGEISDYGAQTAGRKKALMPGQSLGQLQDDFNSRYDSVHGGWTISNPFYNAKRIEAFEKALEAVGRDEQTSVFARLIEDERRKSFIQTSSENLEQYSLYGAGKEQARNGRSNIPIPRQRPGSMSVADQYASYGAGREQAKFWDGYQGPGASAPQDEGVQALQQIVDRNAQSLEQAGQDLENGGEQARDNLAAGGEQAASAIREAADFLRAAVKSLSFASSRPTQVNADVGRSGGDVASPAN